MFVGGCRGYFSLCNKWQLFPQCSNLYCSVVSIDRLSGTPRFYSPLVNWVIIDVFAFFSIDLMQRLGI